MIIFSLKRQLPLITEPVDLCADCLAVMITTASSSQFTSLAIHNARHVDEDDTVYRCQWCAKERSDALNELQRVGR